MSRRVSAIVYETELYPVICLDTDIDRDGIKEALADGLVRRLPPEVIKAYREAEAAYDKAQAALWDAWVDAWQEGP